MDRSSRRAFQHRAAAGVFADEDEERDGGDHENDGSPGGEFGEHVGRPAGSEGCLRSLTAEGAGEIGAFGGQGSQTAFGPRGAANMLTKLTTWGAIIFMSPSIPPFVSIAKPPGGGPVLEGRPPPPINHQGPAPKIGKRSW